jgi:putative membrane protein
MTQQLQKIAQDPKTACDKLFILEAAKCNMMEQSIAQQVAQKAQNDQVKQLAQRIVQDHAQAQQQLQQAAQQLDLQLPQQASPMEQQVIQIIASVPADQFDKQFVAHMQANHARDILLYQTEAQLGQSDPAKQYASQTLPTLQKHQQQTQQVAQALGLPNGQEAVPAGARIGADNTSSGRSDSAGTQNQNTSGGTSGTGQSTSPGGTSGTAGSGATR